VGDLQSRLKVGVPLALISLLFIFSPEFGAPWFFKGGVIALGVALLIEASRTVGPNLRLYILGLGVPLLFLPPYAVLLAILIIGATRSMEPTKEEVASIFSILLIVGGITSLSRIEDPMMIFASVLSVSFADIGAYFIGRALGGPKISELSPNKTLSGLVGGVVIGSLTFGLLSSEYALGIAVVMGSALSDLLESRIKRLLGLKDMGHLLGAHGGFFDRVDSHLGAWIVLYVWL
jgi:phosphatidate cytidylyltransferase